LKFKIGQNLPAEFAALLCEGGFEAHSADDEGLGGADDGVISQRVRAKRCVLVSLDLGFADIPAYPKSIRVSLFFAPRRRTRSG
jgi:predicted nuclease of predicted toxin-antitoxin system